MKKFIHKKGKIKGKKILKEGDILDDWACDIGSHSNIGIEYIVVYNNDYYSIVKNTEDGKIVSATMFEIDPKSLKKLPEAIQKDLEANEGTLQITSKKGRSRTYMIQKD